MTTTLPDPFIKPSPDILECNHPFPFVAIDDTAGFLNEIYSKGKLAIGHEGNFHFLGKE